MGMSDERGQATPLWAVILVLAGLLLIPTGRLIRATVERAEARSAADAAALAGALAEPGRGEDEARAMAAANGATLVDFGRDGDEVTVTVQIGEHRATARAERDVIRVPSTETPRRWPP